MTLLEALRLACRDITFTIVTVLALGMNTAVLSVMGSVLFPQLSHQ